MVQHIPFRFFHYGGQVVAGRLSLAVVRLQKVYTGPGTAEYRVDGI